MTLKLKEWEAVGGLTHVSTEWGVYSDSECTVELDNYVSTTDLTMYTSNVVIPLNDTYYIRARRTLSDETVLPWTLPKAVSNTDTTSSLMLNSDINIQQPHIVVNIGDIKNNNIGSFIIESGDYQSENTIHDSTHWIITSGNGDILYKSLYDKINLTTIHIDKTNLNLNSNKIINISCIFNSAEGFSSPTDIVSITLNNYNFEIKDRLINIPPYIDYNIDIIKINQDENNGIVGAGLMAYNTTDILWSTSYINETNIITIPKSFLLPGKDYVLIISVIDSGVPVSHKLKLTTRSNLSRENIVKNYIPEYIQSTTSIPSTTAYFESIYTANQMFDGNVPMCVGDTNLLSLYNLDSNNQMNFVKILGNLGSIDPVGFYSKLLDTNKLLISINRDGACYLIGYDYDPIDRTISNSVTIGMYSGSDTYGKNNGVVYYNGLGYFLSPDISVLDIKVIDIENMSFVKNIQLPTASTHSRTMIDLGDGRLFVLGSGKDTYIYDIDKDEWTAGPGIPDELKEFDLLSLRYDNGDYIIYKLTSSNDENTVAVFNYETKEFTVLTDNSFKLKEEFRGIIHTVRGFKYIAGINTTTGDGTSLRVLR